MTRPYWEHDWKVVQVVTWEEVFMTTQKAQAEELAARLEKCPLCPVRSKTLITWVGHLMDRHNIEGTFPFTIVLQEKRE